MRTYKTSPTFNSTMLLYNSVIFNYRYGYVQLKNNSKNILGMT
jgi:hypothetical protein